MNEFANCEMSFGVWKLYDRCVPPTPAPPPLYFSRPYVRRQVSPKDTANTCVRPIGGNCVCVCVCVCTYVCLFLEATYAAYGCWAGFFSNDNSETGRQLAGGCNICLLCVCVCVSCVSSECAHLFDPVYECMCDIKFDIRSSLRGKDLSFAHAHTSWAYAENYPTLHWTTHLDLCYTRSQTHAHTRIWNIYIYSHAYEEAYVQR